MRNLIVLLLTPIVFLAPVFATEVENNPALYLNPQDVPFFSSGNPLDGLMEFNVLIPQVSKDEKVNKKIKDLIEKELNLVGSVVMLKSGDMRGFGAGTLLNIQIARILTGDGAQLPILRTTLSIQTFVIMQKTNLNCFPRVWTINDFTPSPLDSLEEEKYIESIKRVAVEFSKNYKFSNRDQKKKPTFYFY